MFTTKFNTILVHCISKFQHENARFSSFLHMPAYRTSFPLNFALKCCCQNSASFQVFSKIIFDKEGCLTLTTVIWKNSTGEENGKTEDSVKELRGVMNIMVTVLIKGRCVQFAHSIYRTWTCAPVAPVWHRNAKTIIVWSLAGKCICILG